MTILTIIQVVCLSICIVLSLSSIVQTIKLKKSLNKKK